MNYKVIRTSDDHLEHHGILGMKWGVWNDETRARRQGKRKNRIQKGTEQHQERIRKNKERWNNPKLKAAAKTGTAVVASLLAGYGLLKLDKVLADKRFLKEMAKYPSSSDVKRRVNQNLMDDYMNNLKSTLDNATRASRMRNSINSARNQYIFTGNDKAWKNIMSDMSNVTIDDLRKLDLY